MPGCGADRSNRPRYSVVEPVYDGERRFFHTPRRFTVSRPVVAWAVSLSKPIAPTPSFQVQVGIVPLRLSTETDNSASTSPSLPRLRAKSEACSVLRDGSLDLVGSSFWKLGADFYGDLECCLWVACQQIYDFICNLDKSHLRG